MKRHGRQRIGKAQAERKGTQRKMWREARTGAVCHRAWRARCGRSRTCRAGAAQGRTDLGARAGMFRMRHRRTPGRMACFSDVRWAAQGCSPRHNALRRSRGWIGGVWQPQEWVLTSSSARTADAEVTGQRGADGSRHLPRADAIRAVSPRPARRLYCPPVRIWRKRKRQADTRDPNCHGDSSRRKWRIKRLPLVWGTDLLGPAQRGHRRRRQGSGGTCKYLVRS